MLVAGLGVETDPLWDRLCPRCVQQFWWDLPPQASPQAPPLCGFGGVSWFWLQWTPPAYSLISYSNRAANSPDRAGMPSMAVVTARPIDPELFADRLAVGRPNLAGTSCSVGSPATVSTAKPPLHARRAQRPCAAKATADTFLGWRPEAYTVILCSPSPCDPKPG
jgi:hypothetical protein